MINHVKISRYKDHLLEDLHQKSKTSHSNQYEMVVSMVEPIGKEPIPREIIKGYSVTNPTQTFEDILVGTKTINRPQGGTQRTVTVTFYNQLIIRTDEENNQATVEVKPTKTRVSNTKFTKDILSSHGETAKLDDVSTMDYFLMIDGNYIMPSDGTILLEKEFYFRIEGKSLDKHWNKKDEIDGDYIIESITPISYADDNDEITTFEINFKEII